MIDERINVEKIAEIEGDECKHSSPSFFHDRHFVS